MKSAYIDGIVLGLEINMRLIEILSSNEAENPKIKYNRILYRYNAFQLNCELLFVCVR